MKENGIRNWPKKMGEKNEKKKIEIKLQGLFVWSLLAFQERVDYDRVMRCIIRARKFWLKLP